MLIFGTNRAVRWADVAAGKYDAELRAQAGRAAAFKTPVLVSFSQDPRPLARPRGAGAARGYRAAYRHVRAVFDAAGATNAVWVWWVRGEVDHAAEESALWPGTEVVDWIAYSPIEDSACAGTQARTPAQTFAPWYQWITHQAWAAGKPIALAGYASAGGPSADRGAWYAQVPAALAAMPGSRPPCSSTPPAAAATSGWGRPPARSPGSGPPAWRRPWRRARRRARPAVR